MSLIDFAKRIRGLLISILVGYVLVLGLLRIFESHLLFFPDDPGRLSGDWNPKGLPVQEVWLTSSDGTKLHAWWIPNEKGTFTFLAFHGNAGNIADRAEISKFLWDTPANVLAVEYRGYGKSEGSPGESGFYLDAEAAFEYLVNSRGISPKKIVSFGQSLGTAIAAHLAAQHEVGGVVLEAPFPSATQVVRRVFWFLPGLGVLVVRQLDTERKLKQVSAPKLIVHCTQDPVIPPQLGEDVYERSRQPKTLLRIDGYCHEEASVIAPAMYRASLQKFLADIETSSKTH